MERERLLRGVSVLQACVRGFLVRRHIQRLRDEYEAVVREIEGDLGTLQWTEGWIPRPQFLPEKAKSHRTCKPQERAPNPEQQWRGRFSCKEPEREAVFGEMMLKQSGQSSANSGSLPCRGDSPPPQDEHSRKARNPSQEETRAMSGKENPEAVGPGLPHSQTKLQELQYHHSHLAMELLWLQQAINSRKEYLILKQTLTSPEASQMRDKPSMCPDHRAQTCVRAGSQTSPPLKDKFYRDRTIKDPDHVDNSSWRLKSQPHKSLESLATTDKTTAGVKYRDPCNRRARAQLPTLSNNQALENRLTREPHRGGPCLQLMRVPEDQIPKGLEPTGYCSEKARMQVPTLGEDLDIEDKSPRKPERKEPDCQRARPRELDLSEDCGIWDETLAEHGGQDLWETKPPKGQIPSEKSSRDRTSSEPSHEQSTNQRAVPWRSRPPKKLSLTESAHTGEDHWKDKPWKTGPPG
ncbi:IQ domain-containing protein C [Leopardus geoffroyi]|uniref:IQ domain-containing protein C n=1 Tax=Leopardus geoffroyi TaxID=46844 RepID=UPI001E263751|nr:IQ domain-containing protein C [Leopardus geoffroyi]